MPRTFLKFGDRRFSVCGPQCAETLSRRTPMQIKKFLFGVLPKISSLQNDSVDSTSTKILKKIFKNKHIVTKLPPSGESHYIFTQIYFPILTLNFSETLIKGFQGPQSEIHGRKFQYFNCKKSYAIFCNFFYIFITQPQQIWSQDFNQSNFEKKFTQKLWLIV